jgi:hypothetical protein
VGVIRIYYGNPNRVPDPPGQSCSGANSETGQNRISSPAAPANRFEIGNTGTYVTYADALAATNGGTDRVVGAQLTLDSGFAGDQRANVSNVTRQLQHVGPEDDRDDDHHRRPVREDLHPACR